MAPIIFELVLEITWKCIREHRLLPVYPKTFSTTHVYTDTKKGPDVEHSKQLHPKVFAASWHILNDA